MFFNLEYSIFLRNKVGSIFFGNSLVIAASLFNQFFRISLLVLLLHSTRMELMDKFFLLLIKTFKDLVSTSSLKNLFISLELTLPL